MFSFLTASLCCGLKINTPWLCLSRQQGNSGAKTRLPCGINQGGQWELAVFSCSKNRGRGTLSNFQVKSVAQTFRKKDKGWGMAHTTPTVRILFSRVPDEEFRKISSRLLLTW